MRTILTICLSIAIAMFTFDANANTSMKQSEYSYSNERASLSISNSSDYTLTIKIMKSSGGLYTTIILPAKSSQTVYFSYSGSFYTKIKAENNWETIYKKDSSFMIQCDDSGYTEASMSYYISSNGCSAGKSISKNEFESNY